MSTRPLETPAASVAAPTRDVHEDALVGAVRRGDPHAFDHLYATYAGEIFNLAVRILRDRHEAEDATQEVFLKAYRRLPKTSGDVRLGAWLRTITTTTCFDALRRRNARPQGVAPADETTAVASDAFEQATTARLVEETLRRLDERQRTALILKDLHGLRHDEIGDALGIREGAAKTLLFRARDSFQRTFRGLAPTATPDRCLVAVDVAETWVGKDIPPDRRRELLSHARSCPECRRALPLAGVSLSGLAFLLPPLPLPAALQAPPFAGLTPAAPPPLAPVDPAAGAPATLHPGGLLGPLAGSLAGKILLTAAAVTTVAVGGDLALRAARGGASGGAGALPAARPPAVAPAAVAGHHGVDRDGHDLHHLGDALSAHDATHGGGHDGGSGEAHGGETGSTGHTGGDTSGDHAADGAATGTSGVDSHSGSTTDTHQGDAPSSDAPHE